MGEILNSIENQDNTNRLWNENREEISNYLRNMIDTKCKYVDDEDKEFEKLFKNEENFLKIIVKKVGEFTKINSEKKHVVLFDIDETIGKGYTLTWYKFFCSQI